MSKREHRYVETKTDIPTPAPAHKRPSILGQLFSKPDPEPALRQKILDFVYQPQHNKHFERALSLYFGPAALRQRTVAVDEDELPNFQEWFVFDFVLPNGRRLIDLFADDVGPTLPEAEANMLSAWRDINRLRLLEVQSVQPGQSVVVQDLLSEEILTVYDRSASRGLRRWIVMLVRPHQAVDRICFTGSALMLTPMHKANMLKAARQLWEAYRAKHPEASLSDFHRDSSLDLIQAMRHCQAEAARPAKLVTAEGHPVMEARAEYVVRRFETVRERLMEAEEFNYAGPSEDKPNAEHFNWLMRGRSRVPETQPHEEGALALSTDWTMGPGKPSYRSLGDLTLTHERLELECMSRERLEAGKALLAELLGDSIRHKRDRVRPTKLQAPAPFAQPTPLPARPAPQRRLSAEEKAMQEQFVREHTEKWLNDPIPKLGDLSPRQAVATPEGRAEVIELLKVSEYMADEREARGEAPLMDLARIRRELGLPDNP
jgi:hypothetical protein